MRIAWKPLGWGLFALLAVVILLGALTLRHWWSEALDQNGIEALEWQGLHVSLSGLSAEELKLAQSRPARDIVLHAREVRLRWRWPDWQELGEGAWQPRLTELAAGSLKLDWHPGAGKSPVAEPSQPNQWPPELPVWFPSDINVQHFEAILPWLGNISGNVELTLEIGHGQWRPDTLKADLELTHPAAWINKIPKLMRPDSFTLSVRPAKAIASSSPDFPAAKTGTEQPLLPLNVTLRSHGATTIFIDSHLAVAIAAPWAVRLGKTQLSATMPELSVSGWLLTKPDLQIDLAGWVNTTGAALILGEHAVLAADTIQPALAAGTEQEMRLKGFRADLANARLKASYSVNEGKLDELRLSGSIAADTSQLKHPQLLPQPWHFRGKLESDLSRTGIAGVLKAKSGTSVNLDLSAPYQGPLTVEGKIQVNGEQEAEALSRTFTAWPPLLTVSDGDVSAHIAYEKSPNAPMRLSGNLSFTDWSGTYDRTAWSEMNGSADFNLKGEQVSIQTSGLKVGTVNPGLPVGPVLVAGGYEAPLKQLAAGQLTLKQASSGALGGELYIQPGTWDFSKAPVIFQVKLDKLSLARLLKLYPAEGLAGTGTLSGTLPVQFDPAAGISVKQGHIDALKPGGRLQVTAERLKTLASKNESMKLVVQALENFHYSVLSSSVNYGEDGTLMMNLHLKGNNPDVAKGQSVVLNVNLEENVPALLTSLQLSGRVSDAVTERVRKMLKRREHSSDELLE